MDDNYRRIVNSSSPRIRRYFLLTLTLYGYCTLFSAHAEVFPWMKGKQPDRDSLLRACGGISGFAVENVTAFDSSPRMRRYFHRRV